MQLVTANLQQFFQLVDFTFRNAVQSTPVLYNRFAQRVPSKTEKNVYAWLAETPSIREWLGPRQVNNLRTRDYSLTNKRFESTIGLDVDKLADDTYGFFDGYTEMLGRRVAEFPDQELGPIVETGKSTACWDGQFFFDTDHPVDIDNPAGATYSNNLVGASYDLAADPKGAFQAARASMMKFKRDDGKPMGIVGNLLMVGPDLESAAKTAVEAVFITDRVKEAGANVAAAAPTNVFQGVATVVVNPWLQADPGAAYLLCTTRGIMPFLYQDREGPSFVPRVDPGSDNVFNQQRLEWGVKIRAAFGYTFPFLALRFGPT